MLNTTRRRLKFYAAVIWYLGAIVLALKAFRLLGAAESTQPDLLWPWIVLPASFCVGGLKARFIFSKACRENLARIEGLKNPKVWQFFRPGFLVCLLVMIVLGASLSKMAQNNYPFLIGMAVLDFSIAVALLGSSIVFWK